MNRLLYIIFLFQISFGFAQPSLDWAKLMSGTGYEYGNATIMDQNGDVYTTGHFRSTTDFDPGPAVYNLTPNGDQDIFLLKLNHNGDFLWCISFGGATPSSSYNDFGTDLALDSQGNILVVGSFKGTADFDPSLNNYPLTSSGMADIFIAKYNSSGSFVWAKNIGGNNIDYATSIEVDSNDDVIVSGQYYGTVDFDPGVTTFNLQPTLPYNSGSNSPSSDMFVFKLNSIGDFLWAKSTGDHSDDILFSTVDNNGNVLSTGRFAGTVDFNPGAGVNNLTSTPSYNSIFVRKLDAAGNYIWACNFNGSLNCEGTSIKTDDLGNVLVTGYFQGTVDFDPSLGVANLTSTAMDAFILKLDPNMNFMWVKQVASNNNGFEAVVSIDRDSYNNIYYIGYSTSNGPNVDLNPNSGTFYLPNDNGPFLVKLNSNGNFEWAIRAESGNNVNTVQLVETTTGAGGGGVNGGYCINVSDTTIYITGALSNSADFDPSASTLNLTANGSGSPTDIFVHKLFQCQNSSSSLSISSCSNYTAPSGQILNISGVFLDTIPNALGCDSIITINLIINQPTSSSISPNACGSYTAPDGQVYTSGGTYTATVTNSAGCDSVITINLTINPLPSIDAGFSQAICEGYPVTLSGSGGVAYTWDNGVTDGIPFNPITTQTYTLTGTDANGCSNTDQVTVTVTPAPIVSFSVNQASGCIPLTAVFTNTTADAQTCNWDFGNGLTSTNCNPTEVFNVVGCYDVALTVSNSGGCSATLISPDLICVYPYPVADFTTAATSISNNQTVTFTNTSTGASSYTWNLGDGTMLLTTQDAEHYYQITNQDSIIIELVATSTAGCSDTATLILPVNRLGNSGVFIPTGLSPNNDGENDMWTVEGLENYPDVVIQVYNRWGELLFEGNQSNSSWNGYFQGKLLPTADYYYIVDLGNDQKFNGVVTLKQ